MIRSRLVRVLAECVLLAAAASVAGAQVPGGRCSLSFTGTATTRMRSAQVAGGRYHSFIGGGYTARCDGQDVTLQADSAESYEETNTVILIGTVRYREPRARLTSRRLTYYMTEERLLAEGDVVITLPSGTVTKGPIVEYFRAVPAVRKESRMWSPSRSQTSLVQKDSSGKPAEPVLVEADRTTTRNDSLVFLGGRVTITRSDLVSSSDSAALDGGTGLVQLVGGAVVRGRGERSFTLESINMDLHSQNKVLRRVLAKGSGRAISADMDLTADTILMDVDSNKIERARAWGAKRALVLSNGRRMLSDSLDVVMPGQKVREVHLLRGAYAESDVDTVRILTTERDWIRGDTLVAQFDTVPTRDTTAKTRVRTITATGTAKSFYQMASSTGDRLRPALNYVRGRQITAQFDTAGLTTVDVDEKAVGLYLEPRPDSVTAAAAKAAAKKAAGQSPDSSRSARPAAPAGRAPVPTKPDASAPSATSTTRPSKPAGRGDP